MTSPRTAHGWASIRGPAANRLHHRRATGSDFRRMTPRSASGGGADAIRLRPHWSCTGRSARPVALQVRKCACLARIRRSTPRVRPDSPCTSRSSAPATSAWSPAPAWPRSATRWSASTSMPTRSTRLNRGEVPIFEPGLEDLVAANRDAGRLRFTTDAKAAMAHGAGRVHRGGHAAGRGWQRRPLARAGAWRARSARTLERHAVVVNKSTVPVGTADRVRGVIAAELAARGAAIEFDVVSNPEFLKEGDAVKDCMRPDRIVIGSGRRARSSCCKQLYAPFNRNHERFVLMDVRSAELTKYAANAMLATKISFMNEMANIAERVGADIELVRHGIGSDPRIGYCVHLSGRGLRRLVLPQGRAGAGSHRARRTATRRACSRRSRRSTRRRSVACSNCIRQHFGGDAGGPHHRAVGPGLQAQHRRHARSAVARAGSRRCGDAGARVRAYDPEAHDEARARLRPARRPGAVRRRLRRARGRRRAGRS